MSQTFHPRMNLVARASLLAVILLLASLAGLGIVLPRSPLVTGVGVAKVQPVAYSHRQHVGELGLDCRYCHTAVEESSSAGIPATAVCMGCHAQVATDSPALKLVQASYAENRPIPWVRVHDLPDYVYFNHAIHVQKGVGCETCHGRVDQMTGIAKAETLQMAWCLGCHRAPDHFLRPLSAITTMGWEAPVDQAALVAEYGIQTAALTDCSICHR